MDDMKKCIAAARRKAIAAIRSLSAPHMHESGFRVGPVGNSRPMKLWAPKDRHGKTRAVKMNGYVLTTFWGLSEIGVITDAYGGGCITQPISGLPLEDLLMLHQWALKNLPVMQPPKRED